MVRRRVASGGSLGKPGDGFTVFHSACADGRRPADQRFAREGGACRYCDWLSQDSRKPSTAIVKGLGARLPWNNGDLDRSIPAQNPHFFNKDVKRAVNAIFDEIEAALVRRERVELRGFGTFVVNRAHGCTATGSRLAGLTGNARRGVGLPRGCAATLRQQ